MLNCCGIDTKSFREQFECDLEETEEGVQVKIKAKDPNKTDSLKAMFKAYRDFSGCC